jgi:hypothetical protein
MVEQHNFDNVRQFVLETLSPRTPKKRCHISGIGGYIRRQTPLLRRLTGALPKGQQKNTQGKSKKSSQQGHPPAKLYAQASH